MSWEIFYTPHTDDETIGMAGAIIRAHDAGHEVLVCLVTDNQPSTRGRSLFPDKDLTQIRREEWVKAMQVLGVNEWQTWELSEAEMERRPDHIRADIRQHMLNLSTSRDVALHHTTWGIWDHNDGVRCLAHDLCARAAYEMSYLINAWVKLYSIYEYAKPEAQRSAPIIERLTPDELAWKRRALQAYYPVDGSIGYGYRSVPELMDAASTDPREFVIDVRGINA